MQGFALPWSRNSFRLRFWFTFKRVSLFWDFVHSTTKMIFGWGFVSSLSRDMFIVIFTLIIWEMINWEMMIWWSILMINWSDDNHHPPWSSDLYFHLDHLRKDLGKAEKIFSHRQPTVLPGKNIDLIEIQFLGIPRASKNKSKKNKNKKTIAHLRLRAWSQSWAHRSKRAESANTAPLFIWSESRSIWWWLLWLNI